MWVRVLSNFKKYFFYEKYAVKGCTAHPKVLIFFHKVYPCGRQAWPQL